MRKVKVSRKEFVPGVVLDPAKPNIKTVGKWEQRDYYAVFHDFGLDTDNSQGHNEIYPVAILERGDGTIEVVHVEQIQFINPTLYKTCENQS